MDHSLIDSLFGALPIWALLYLLIAFAVGLFTVFGNATLPPGDKDMDDPIEVISYMAIGIFWPFVLWEKLFTKRTQSAIVSKVPKRKSRKRKRRR